MTRENTRKGEGEKKPKEAPVEDPVGISVSPKDRSPTGVRVLSPPLGGNGIPRGKPDRHPVN